MSLESRIGRLAHAATLRAHPTDRHALPSGILDGGGRATYAMVARNMQCSTESPSWSPRQPADPSWNPRYVHHPSRAVQETERLPGCQPAGQLLSEIPRRRDPRKHKEHTLELDGLQAATRPMRVGECGKALRIPRGALAPIHTHIHTEGAMVVANGDNRARVTHNRKRQLQQQRHLAARAPISDATFPRTEVCANPNTIEAPDAQRRGITHEAPFWAEAKYAIGRLGAKMYENQAKRAC